MDWPELNSAIDATGARRVFVTHGYTHTFRRWLEERGFEAHIVDTEYSGEQLDGEGTGPGDAEPSEATETSQ